MRRRERCRDSHLQRVWAVKTIACGRTRWGCSTITNSAPRCVEVSFFLLEGACRAFRDSRACFNQPGTSLTGLSYGVAARLECRSSVHFVRIWWPHTVRIAGAKRAVFHCLSMGFVLGLVRDTTHGSPRIEKGWLIRPPFRAGHRLAVIRH